MLIAPESFASSCKHEPALSLILVTMNRKVLLESCLRSLEKQLFDDVEIIVVDNASTDGTGDMVHRQFPNVRYFYLANNLGPPGGRNYGAKMSRGELCVFIDDDAFFAEDNALQKVVLYFRADSDLGCIAFRIMQPQDGREEYKSIPRADKKIINEDYECSYFCGAGFAVRRNLFLELGMFWEPLFFIGEELDFSYRLISQGYKMLHSFAITIIHHETMQARVKGQWIYYSGRSRILVAARNLPWRYVISHTLLWWGYLFFAAIKNRHLIFFIRGVKDAVVSFPKALDCRTCISEDTVDKLRKLSGRIYY